MPITRPPQRNTICSHSARFVMRSRPSQCRGMSAAELLIALATALILCAIGVPSLARMQTSAQLTSTKSALILGLNRARAEAVSTGRNLIICPSANGRQCLDASDWSDGWLIYRDDNRNSRFDPVESLVLYHQADASEVNVRSNAGRRRITYRSLGDSEGANSTFILCSQRDRGEGRQVIIGNSGRVRGLSFAPATACATL